jgi:hypothetical protein
VLLDAVQNPHQTFLGYDQGVAIHEEYPVLPLHVFGSEKDISKDNFVVLDPEPFAFVGAAKSALVVGASHGHLKEDTVGLTGWSYTGAFVMHFFACNSLFHLISVLVSLNPFENIYTFGDNPILIIIEEMSNLSWEEPEDSVESLLDKTLTHMP